MRDVATEPHKRELFNRLAESSLTLAAVVEKTIADQGKWGRQRRLKWLTFSTKVAALGTAEMEPRQSFAAEDLGAVLLLQPGLH